VLNYFRDMNGELLFLDIVKYAELIDEQNVLEFVSIIVAADKKYLKAIRASKDISLPE
jgi:hypothetical protein